MSNLHLSWVVRYAMATLFLLLLYSPLIAQQIDIVITDTAGQSIANSIITFSEFSDSNSVREFISLDTSRVSYDLTGTYDKLFIKVTSLGYADQRLTVDRPQAGARYDVVFRLAANGADLDEIVVRARRKPYQEQGDTVIYQVAGFADGSERKIDEVLAKMPGITVDARSGTIRYQGKPVETVQLDGDNLFDREYTIGTRNINAQSIDRVEAIDNYQENPVLGGLGEDGKVALNLILAEGKTDLSGSVDLGLGEQDGSGVASDGSLTLLSVAKKFKSFSVLSHNNVGIGRSPYDPFSPDLFLEQQQRSDFVAPQPIGLRQPELIPQLEDRSIINKESFGNYSGLVRWSSRLSSRLRITGLGDRVRLENIYRSIYEFADSTLRTSDATAATLTPRRGTLDLLLTYQRSPQERLVYNVNTSLSATAEMASVVQNDARSIVTNLELNDDRIDQRLEWTKRLPGHRALEITVQHRGQFVDQDYLVNPGVLGQDRGADDQSVGSSATTLRAESALLGKLGPHKYRQGIGVRHRKLTLMSQLSSAELADSNQVAYETAAAFLAGQFSFKKRKVSIIPQYTLTLQDMRYRDQGATAPLRQTNLLFRPSLLVRYRLAKRQRLEAFVSYRPGSDVENHLYTNNILTSSRTLDRHQPDLRIQHNQFYQLTYALNNLQLGYEATLALSHQTRLGNFLPRYAIDATLSQVRYSFLPASSSASAANWMLSRTLLPLRLTLRYEGGYNQNRYQNFLEEGGVRNNRLIIDRHQLTAVKTFPIPISVSQTLAVESTRARSENIRGRANTGLVTTTNLALTVRKRMFISLNALLYYPNLSDPSTRNFFLDARMRYRFEKKPFEFRLSLQNLTNTRTFNQRTVTDLAIRTTSVALRPRQLLLLMAYDF